MNIYPIEIESLLEQLPEVKECAAFPLQLDGHGEMPAVAIVLHRGIQDSDQAYLKGYLNQHMGKRSPKRIFIIDALPRNPRGKVLKYQLKEFFSKKIRQ